MKPSSIFSVIRKECALIPLTWDLYQPGSNRHTFANLLIGGMAVKGNRQLTIGPTTVSIISPILIRTMKFPEEFLYKYAFLISSPMPSGLAILKREPQFSGYFVTITKILKAISIEMGIRAKLLWICTARNGCLSLLMAGDLYSIKDFLGLIREILLRKFVIFGQFRQQYRCML